MLLKPFSQSKLTGYLVLFMVCLGGFYSFSKTPPKTVASLYTANLQWYTHEDTDLGFTVQLPEKPNYTDEYNNFTIYSYNKPDAKTVFSFFGLDFRSLQKEKDDHTIVDDMITNTVNNLRGELLDKKKINYANGLRYEILVKVNDTYLMRSQLTLQNGIMFYLSVEDLANKIQAQEIDTFFKSLIIDKPKVIEAKPLITYKNDIGGFSLKIPEEPKDVSREVANPIDEESDPYILNMFVSTDLENNDNFLFRYNDQPLGYYVQDVPASFDEMATVLSSTAEIVSEPKSVYLDGYEGREYELMIEGKYHSICRVYFRGNRTYLLLKQKLNSTDKVTVDHPFFTDFKFEPYLPSQPEKINPKDTNFEVLFYEDNRVIVDDTEDYSDTYLIGSTDSYANNPNSGGLYHLSHSELRDYFKITSKKEFYDTNIEAFKEWNDSIVDLKQITFKGIEAATFNLVNETTKVTTKHKIWLDGKRLIVMSGYLGKEEFNSALTDSIFNSYEVISNPISFDYLSSKTDLILEDLKSKDSLTYTNAFGAFSYYIFDDESDVSKLHKALKETYADSVKTEAVRIRIVDELADTHNDNTLSIIEELYSKDGISDDLKTSILTTIPYLESDNKLDVYKTLLLQSPPKSEDSYSYGILAPFRDSLSFTVSNFKELVTLVDHKTFRDDIITISTTIIENETEGAQVVNDHLEQLLKHVDTDLKSYESDLENAEDPDFTYNAAVTSYLNLLNKINYTSETTNRFTNALIDKNNNKWYILLALTARIFNDQPVEESFLEEKMDSLYYRLEVMQAYQKSAQFKKIPKKYLKSEAFAELSLFNYVYDDYSEPDGIKALGKINHDNKTYYAFSVTYNVEDTTETSSSIAIVGPVEPLSESTELVRFTSYSNWETPEKDWKAQAIEMIPDLEAYGY